MAEDSKSCSLTTLNEEKVTRDYFFFNFNRIFLISFKEKNI